MRLNSFFFLFWLSYNALYARTVRSLGQRSTLNLICNGLSHTGIRHNADIRTYRSLLHAFLFPAFSFSCLSI